MSAEQAATQRVHEHLISKVVRAGAQATGLFLTSPMGEWTTRTMINAENQNVADRALDTNTPATEIYNHLNHLAELHQGWSSMGVDAAQILIGGVLVLDSLAVDKKKPMTVGRTFTEAVTTMAAMTSPILLTEIVNIAQNAIELEHVATTFGELAILAVGAHKIGSAIARIMKGYSKSKSDHLASKGKIANSKKIIVTKLQRDPNEAKKKDEKHANELIDFKRRGRKLKENNLRFDLNRESSEKIEATISELRSPLPQPEKSVGQLALEAAKSSTDEYTVKVKMGSHNSDIPSFIKDRIENRK